MSGNIVKEILLKFRSDTKDVDRNVKQMQTGINSLQKTIAGGSQAGSIGTLNKTLTEFTKTSQKFGMSINKDMSKFQKTIQDVAQKDLRVLQQQTDTLFKKTEDRLRRLKTEENRLGRMRSGGESTDQIQHQERVVARRRALAAASEGKFSQSAQAFSDLGDNVQGPPSGMSRFKMGLGVFGGIAGAVKVGAEFSERYATARSEQTAFLSSTLQQRRMNAYRGDITEAIMQAKDQSMTKSQQFADAQTSRRKLGLWGSIGVGAAALLAAPFTGGGSLIAGAAALGGATAIGYGALGLSTTDQYNEQQRQAEFGREKQRNMTAINYQYLQGKAPGRYNFQRQMQMSDSDALSLRTAGYNNRFSEAESSGAAMALRGTFGNAQGGSLSRSAMELARRQGMDLGSATGLTQMTAMTGSGKDVKKQLTDVYTDAFSKGIVDSGLLEIFQKGVVDLASRSPDVTNLASMSGRMTAQLDTITAGRGVGARDIQGVMQAQQIMGDVSMQGGESGFSKLTNLAKITRGDPMAQAFLSNRTDEEILQLAQNDDPRLSAQQKKDILQNYDPGKTIATKFRTTAQGRSVLEKAQEGLRQGKSLSEVSMEGGASVEVLGGTGKISREAAAATFAQVLTSEAGGNADLGKLIEGGKAKDSAKMAQTISGIANTPEKRDALQQLLTRKFASDIEQGNDISEESKKYGDIGNAAYQAVIAGRNGRSSNDIDKSVAGAITNNQMEGEKMQDQDASKAFTGDEINQLGISSRSAATAPGKGISESVDTLVSALKSFADAVSSTSNSSNSTSSGGL